MKTLSFNDIQNNIGIVKPIVVLTEKTVFVVTDFANQFELIKRFLGIEPKVLIDKGVVSLKIKGFKPFSNHAVIVKDGTQVVEILTLEQVTQKYQLLKIESLPLNVVKEESDESTDETN